MFGSGPSTIDPIQLAKRGARLQGTLPVSTMARLAEMCCDDSGEVIYDLQFERSGADGLCLLHGALHASVHVTCQRCLEPMTLDLGGDMQLILLRPGEREDLAQEPDTLIVEKPVSLSDIAEDELLLVMPMIPMHEPNRCPASGHLRSRSTKDASADEGARASSPFSALADVKKKEK